MYSTMKSNFGGDPDSNIAGTLTPSDGTFPTMTTATAMAKATVTETPC